MTPALACGVLAAIFAGVHPALAGDGDDALAFFPRTRLFPKLVADGTSPGLSLNKDTQTRRWIGAIGGTQRVLEYRTAGTVFQLGIGATVYASLLRQPRVLEVLTADFYVDIPLEIRLSQRIVLRTGYGHYSAHFADDGIESLGLHSINYAKDFVPLMAALLLPEMGGFVYGGARLDYYTIPEDGRNWILQAGIEGGNIDIAPDIRLYAAVDLKAKAEVRWGTTQSYQVGLRVFPRDAQALRITWTVRTGIDDRGQFYRNRITLNLVGIALDL